jgi:hypothetical protein
VTARAALIGLLEALERAAAPVVALVRGGRAPEPWTLFPEALQVAKVRALRAYRAAHREGDPFTDRSLPCAG